MCIVGDEAFRELSRADDDAPKLLAQAIAKDSSREWRAGKLKRQEAAGAADGKAAEAEAEAAAATPAAAAAEKAVAEAAVPAAGAK